MVINKILKFLEDSIHVIKTYFGLLQLMLKKEFPNEGKSQQFLLISEVNSYLNAVNFQAI